MMKKCVLMGLAAVMVLGVGVTPLAAGYTQDYLNASESGPANFTASKLSHSPSIGVVLKVGESMDLGTVGGVHFRLVLVSESESVLPGRSVRVGRSGKRAADDASAAEDNDNVGLWSDSADSNP